MTLRNTLALLLLLCPGLSTLAQVPGELGQTEPHLNKQPQPDAARPFPPAAWPIIDSLQHHNKPKLNLPGVALMDRQAFRTNEDRTYAGIDMFNTYRFAKSAADAGKIVIIDVEHWPTDIRWTDDATAEMAHRQLAYLVDLMRTKEPTLRIGIYSLMPPRDYWAPARYHQAKATLENWPTTVPAGSLPRGWWQNELKKSEAMMAEWETAADRFNFSSVDGERHERGLADRVDVIYPSLYIFYDVSTPEGLKGAEAYFRENLRLARKYGKDVYPFIWWFYHDSNKTLGNQRIPLESFKQLMKVVREESDGVVLWGGWQQPWNEQDTALLNAVYEVDRAARAQPQTRQRTSPAGPATQPSAR